MCTLWLWCIYAELPHHRQFKDDITAPWVSSFNLTYFMLHEYHLRQLINHQSSSSAYFCLILILSGHWPLATPTPTPTINNSSFLIVVAASASSSPPCSKQLLLSLELDDGIIIAIQWQHKTTLLLSNSTKNESVSLDLDLDGLCVCGFTLSWTWIILTPVTLFLHLKMREWKIWVSCLLPP